MMNAGGLKDHWGIGCGNQKKGARASGIECPNVAKPVFDATSRAAVLAKHNEYRAMLTHGTAQYKGMGLRSREARTELVEQLRI
ncbi:unnamed protein product [Toxocara canis]|uniref:SCP domain-containing protein n=1 Tax=Toxocara canis TaxID=6265 RepID=A0A183VHC5_TOXCA|nr:unnamed protein product [Toxocara canis]